MLIRREPLARFVTNVFTKVGATEDVAREVADHLVDLVEMRERNWSSRFAPREDVVERYTRRSLAGRLAKLLDEVVDEGVASERAEADGIARNSTLR